MGWLHAGTQFVGLPVSVERPPELLAGLCKAKRLCGALWGAAAAAGRLLTAVRICGMVYLLADFLLSCFLICYVVGCPEQVALKLLLLLYCCRWTGGRVAPSLQPSTWHDVTHQVKWFHTLGLGLSLPF